MVAEAGNVKDGQALAGSAVFDLALLDINLDGRCISPVAEIIARRDLPFLFVSGYGPAGRPEQFSDRPVLQKPVPISKLRKAIDSMLSSAAEGPLLGTHPAIDREDAKVDRMISSICRGC